MKLWNYKGQQNSITEALQIELPEPAVVSVVGAGGKTSLIFAWARELASKDKRVVITTTTHMMHPDFTRDKYSGRAIICNAAYNPDGESLAEYNAQIDSSLREEKILLIASEDPSNRQKITKAPDLLFDYARSAADVVLIEADGSRQMPLKWPKPHEPVVPECTDISICVAGLSSLGKPVSDVVYASEEMDNSFLSKDVDESLVAAIVSSPDGGLKGTYGDYRVFLNQVDTEEIEKKAEYIQRLLAVRGMQSAWGTLI